MKKMKQIIVGIMAVIMLFGNSMNVGAASNNNSDNRNAGMFLGAPDDAEIHIVDDTQVINEETRTSEENNGINAYANYTASLGDLCYIEQESWIDFGVYYTTNDLNVNLDGLSMM